MLAVLALLGRAGKGRQTTRSQMAAPALEVTNDLVTSLRTQWSVLVFSLIKAVST